MSQWSHLYNSRAWRKRRADLLRHEPLCRYCLRVGRTTEATVADHVEPHKGDPVKFAGPIQPLCASCHSSVKAREEGGSGIIGHDLNGHPIDPGHHWNR